MADDLELYQEICAERGVTEMLHTIVEADVCRPKASLGEPFSTGRVSSNVK